ncbi:MAG TPA: hypothetical protein VF607_13080 [Verrucomicrobiae bacterium]
MNESGQNFDELKKLLKLKRHEVPPPGFFNHFSDEVVSRIRDKQQHGKGSFVDQLEDSAPWLVTFLRFFEARPGVVGGFATSICLVLVFGVVLAEQSENPGAGAMPLAVNTGASTEVSANLAQGNLSSQVPVQFAQASLPNEGGIAISTNASLQPVSTVFGGPSANMASLFQPASFAPAH